MWAAFKRTGDHAPSNSTETHIIKLNNKTVANLQH